MAELSEAEKAEAIAAHNAKVEAARAEGALPAANIEQAPAVPLATQKIGPDMDPAPILEAKAPVPVTPASAQGAGNGDPGEWGPYDDYQIINTGFGEYGLEKGKILFFTIEQKFSAKAGNFITVRVPHYRLPAQTREDVFGEEARAQASRPIRALA